MDSFAWHEAETSLTRATAARVIYEIPGTDLSQARRIPVRAGTSNCLSQPGLEPAESTFVNTTQSREVLEKSSEDTAAPYTGEPYYELPLRATQQTKAAQSVDTQAAWPTSQRGFPFPERPTHEVHIIY